MIKPKNANLFCCEDISLIENYDVAITDPHNTWECHHRAGVLPCGKYSREVLKKFGLYFNRPASELIFLTKAEHRCIHHTGHEVSNHTRKLILDTKRDKQKPVMVFKDGILVDEVDGINEAARKYGLWRANIQKVLRGELNKTGGLVFKLKMINKDITEEQK